VEELLFIWLDPSIQQSRLYSQQKKMYVLYLPGIKNKLPRPDLFNLEGGKKVCVLYLPGIKKNKLPQHDLFNLEGGKKICVLYLPGLKKKINYRARTFLIWREGKRYIDNMW
jgi:hypothetical protein